MSQNIFCFDVETTGLIRYIHGIISLAWVIQSPDGKVLDKGELKINPFSYLPKCKCSPKAFEVNGYTEKQIKTFPDAKKQVKQLIKILNKHYNGNKYKVVAFNASFDTGFLQDLFDKVVPNTYWKLLDYKYVDPFELVK